MNEELLREWNAAIDAAARICWEGMAMARGERGDTARILGERIEALKRIDGRLAQPEADEKVYTQEDASNLCHIAVATYKRGLELKGQPEAAPVAQEPVGEVMTPHDLNDAWLEKLPVGTKLYAAPVAAQPGAMALAEVLAAAVETYEKALTSTEAIQPARIYRGEFQVASIRGRAALKRFNALRGKPEGK